MATARPKARSPNMGETSDGADAALARDMASAR